jgi:hypothetical protein
LGDTVLGIGEFAVDLNLDDQPLGEAFFWAPGLSVRIDDIVMDPPRSTLR